jgi:hypothetical protein
VGIKGNCPAHEIGRGGMIAELRSQYAEQVQRLGVIGVRGDQLAIERACLL